MPMLAGSGHSTELGATMHTEAKAPLIDRLRGGDALALEELMDEFAPRVHRMAYGITRNEADAEEVVQDVFLAPLPQDRRVRGPVRARHVDLPDRRQHRPHQAAREAGRARGPPRGSPADVQGRRASGGGSAMLLADWSETPEEELLANETREAVRRMIAEPAGPLPGRAAPAGTWRSFPTRRPRRS